MKNFFFFFFPSLSSLPFQSRRYKTRFLRVPGYVGFAPTSLHIKKHQVSGSKKKRSIITIKPGVLYMSNNPVHNMFLHKPVSLIGPLLQKSKNPLERTPFVTSPPIFPSPQTQIEKKSLIPQPPLLHPRGRDLCA